MQPHSTPSTSVVKTCTKCGQTKPATIEYFSEDARLRSGFRHQCKRCVAAQRRTWYAATKERDAESRRAFARAWHVANKEKSNERRRKYYAANREREIELKRSYRAGPGKSLYSAQVHRRRARIRNAEGTHTAEDVQAQYKRQKGKCYWCQAKLNKKYEIDHVVPLSRGGSNWPENLVCACQFCNRSKRDKLPHEWTKGGRLL